MIFAKVSERGQISIPAAARKKLGIRPKSKVEVEVREKEIILRPVRSVLEVKGIFRDRVKGYVNWKTARAEMEKRVAEEVANE